VLKPNLEAYYTQLAEIATTTKDWSRAMAYYDTAYYLFKHPYTLYLKGLALQQAGKKTEARQAYKKYLALPIAMQDTSISHYLERILEEKSN
jgi:tetratricopeptide (TPR) repeat protein